jgi:nucleotide-binding universal stress UspA family protein
MLKAILVPIDTAEESSWRRVLPLAVDQARRYGATLHVTTVVEHVEIDLPDLPSPGDISQRRRQGAAAALEAIARAHIPGDVAHERHAAVGNVHREILSLAERIGADLIMMASHRPALKTYLIGTHAARVVRHARCSVYVVRIGDS